MIRNRLGKVREMRKVEKVDGKEETRRNGSKREQQIKGERKGKRVRCEYGKQKGK